MFLGSYKNTAGVALFGGSAELTTTYLNSEEKNMAHFPIVTRDYVVKKASLLNIREMVNCYNSKLPDYKRKKEQELADQVQKMEDGDGVFVTVTCEKNKSRIEGFAQWIPCQYAQPEENERSLYYGEQQFENSSRQWKRRGCILKFFNEC